MISPVPFPPYADVWQQPKIEGSSDSQALASSFEPESLRAMLQHVGAEVIRLKVVEGSDFDYQSPPASYSYSVKMKVSSVRKGTPLAY